MPLCNRQTAFLTECPSAPGRLLFSPEAPLHLARYPCLASRHLQLFKSRLARPSDLFLQTERVQLISRQINQFLSRLRAASGNALPARESAREVAERHVNRRVARAGKLVL